MRILHLLSSRGLFGAERVVIELSRSLREDHNCRPIIGVIRNSHNPHTEVISEAEANGMETVLFTCEGKLDVGLVFRIKKFLRENRIDVIHCHGYKSNFYGLLAAGKAIPTITTNHNWLINGVKSRIYCLLDGWWIRYFDKIVAVSDEIKEDIVKYGISGHRVHVVYNGIDFGRIRGTFESSGNEYDIDGTCKIVGTVGSLTHEKGHVFLLDAAAQVLRKYRNVKFIIVGDGHLRPYLENMARELGIHEKVIFAGYRNDIYQILSRIDIFVLSSVKEGLPMAVLEAIAAEKPVIATRVGAVPKVIDNMETGIVVEPGDAVALTEALLKLLDGESEARRMASRAIESAKKKFSSMAMSEKYLALYREIMVDSSSR